MISIRLVNVIAKIKIFSNLIGISSLVSTITGISFCQVRSKVNIFHGILFTVAKSHECIGNIPILINIDIITRIASVATLFCCFLHLAININIIKTVEENVWNKKNMKIFSFFLFFVSIKM